jgi:long-chain-fatty-acid--[acyl-carrier-protein] ligase
MKQKFWQIIFIWCVQKILSLRYDIKVKGLSRIAQNKLKKESGILFLPNHPAEIDPVILMSILRKNFAPRPLVVEHFYYMSGVHAFMRLVGAFPIPHVETTANQWKVKRVEKAFNTIKQGLQAGENFLIYPSGSLKKEGYEVIGGNSFIHRLIHEYPDVKIVLIRTSGLWGSCFSRALTGEVPNFWKMALSKTKVLCKNWIFFMPRRKLTVEFAIDPEDFPRKGTRLEINKYLENWYNQYEGLEGNIVKEEPLKLVSYDRHKEVYPEITDRKEQSQKKPFFKQKIDVSESIKIAVLEKIAELAEMPSSTIQEEHHLSNDLGLDSLDAANIYTFLDIEYGVRDLKPETIETVSDVMYVAAAKFKAEEEKETPPPSLKTGWPLEEDRPQVERPDGRTLQEAFLRACERLRSYAACADANSGLLTYKKLKLGTLVLSQKIKDYPGDYVGIMLPSSVGVYLTIFATLLAGKIPVMMNWTAGVRTLEYAVQLLEIKVVISSSKFLNKVDSLDMGDLEQLVVTLEDIKHSMSFRDKLSGLFLSFKKPKQILNKLGLTRTVREDDPAVVLFTSGTETYPKAVPLSHKNILENQKASLNCIAFAREDVFYGVLPPFHSFGFNVTGIFPILMGIRVYYAPDPTNAKSMAKDAEAWNISVFCCAPSFFKNLFLVATPKQLKSVRLFVTGAEKAPPELFASVAHLGPHHKMIEGYGLQSVLLL